MILYSRGKKEARLKIVFSLIIYLNLRCISAQPPTHCSRQTRSLQRRRSHLLARTRRGRVAKAPNMHELQADDTYLNVSDPS
ncbi:hypothetical protein M441DRAFT_418174 [Trichoderma asperellum CBS 433.97]|uniref:Secreted protein n=1 Tax=Trichoderma asperellum (strain ATCC 204424 / CBS 433.97 / NBRC 101777) TaxID=1042311 RepID=A0A2T3Z8I8_TRIA4|nr:hypothetical protein M441DRAFT_418174 [Trichoderma asperellum CBS 433.97]PTB41124.1 hypothetical protein M441DRAFT_418174 [Trichoderma asperellum CBS 433.97]